MTDNFPIKEIVIHCADTPDDGKDFSAKDIDAWHKERGFAKIGYHAVIRRSGKIERGREDGEIGAHVYGFNRHRIGVCWIGRSTPATEQYTSLVNKTACLCKQYKLNQGAVKGHSQFVGQGGKTCPNLDMDKFRDDVAARLAELEGAISGAKCLLQGGECAGHYNDLV